MHLDDEPASAPAAPAAGARKALLLLLAINLMNYVDRQILAAVEKPIADEFGVTEFETGWLATSFLLSYMIVSPVFGQLADRMNRWWIIAGGVTIWSLASGGSGVAGVLGVFWFLVVMRVLIGVGEAAYGPVAPTIIADLYPVERRGKVLAWFYAALPVGSALGYVVGGLFHAHWQWAFYLTVPPGIVLAVMCLWMRDPRHTARTVRVTSASDEPARVNPQMGTDPVPVADASHDQPRAGASVSPVVIKPSRVKVYLDLARIKSYTLVTAGMTASTFALGGISFFMPRYLQDRGLSAFTATSVFGGVVVAAGLASTLAGGWAGDVLRKRFAGSYFLVSGIGLILGFPLFLLTLYLPFPLAWVPLAAAVFCLFFSTGPTNAIIANVTPPAVRATAYAANIFVIHALGDVIAYPTVGWLGKHYGMHTAFIVVAVMMLVGGVLWLLGMPHLERDTRRIETA